MNLWLVAALVCGLGLGVTSCKDDDDENKSEEQQQQEQEERASKFWSVVGQLVSSDSYAADYEDKTFEPTYGVADAANATTRIVETNDMQTAAQRFSDLVGAAIDENTPSYTYSDPDVGTLTYTRGGTADDWATVDVNIKQVPRLRKIIYREGGEGTNASFAGKAWYRFGDVVSRTLDDGNVEYWICVRPAFSPEKKGDSHWVCLNYLPAKNVYHYTGSNELEYYLPTGIGTDKEDMQNLAEMLYAMTHPQEWYDNANTYHTDGKVWGFSGLPIFADFKKANVMYHNQYFWQKVADAWEKNEVANDAFGIDFEVLSDHLEQEGLNLLYEGYQWWFKTSWNCKLWQASYTNGTKNDEKNLHHAEYKDISKSMKEIPFDCREMGAEKRNYNKFFDNDGKYRWVIRHATGADLNGGSQPAPTSPLQGKGVKQRYRYYDYYGGEWTKPGPDGKSGKPEVTGDDNDSYNYYVGKSHYKFFNVYKDEEGNRWFPIYESGHDEASEHGTYRLDRSPYTYLISFEGLKYSSDGQRAVNLPNRDLAAKAMIWLYSLLSNTMMLEDDAIVPSSSSGSFAHFLVNNAGFDPRFLFKIVFPPNEEYKNRGNYAPMLATVGYNDEADSNPQQAGGQKLIRFIDYPSEDAERQPTFYIWEHYPSRDNMVRPDKPQIFTGNLIYLGDLASQNMVNQYAEDPYVRQKISTGVYKNMPEANITEPRTQTDNRALKASNYAYDMQRWRAFQQPLDLWREPVLLFRITRVLDRGENDYETTTDDGHKLRLYQQGEWYTIPYDPMDPASNLNMHFVSLISGGFPTSLELMFWDGQPYKPTRWYEDVIKR